MRIGLLVVSIGAFGQSGFYNLQEIGLAKALDNLFDEVIVYKLVPQEQKAERRDINGCTNAHFCTIPSARIGSNGIPKLSYLDRTLDVLVLCADTQISVPKVYSWAVRNNVMLIPYIGVIESHSNSKLKRLIMDGLFQRNITVYKKRYCLVKTPEVKEGLEKLGVKHVDVAPVGLDLSVLKNGYVETDSTTLKQKYGYSAEEKVLLFVSRMIEEKQPLRMVKLFARLYGQNSCYRLLMVGTGELRDRVISEVERQGLSDYVQILERIPNKDIWELYRIADCFVNLNQQEIFGMAILEAMYYGCKVVAWKAPGPSFIIEDGVSGFLADSDIGILEAIAEKTILPEAAHERIINHFTWDKTAATILSIARNS